MRLQCLDIPCLTPETLARVCSWIAGTAMRLSPSHACLILSLSKDAY